MPTTDAYQRSLSRAGATMADDYLIVDITAAVVAVVVVAVVIFVVVKVL